MDFIPRQEQWGWLDAACCRCQSRRQAGLRLSHCHRPGAPRQQHDHHLKGLLCPRDCCAAPARVGHGVSVAFPLLVGCAPRPCARQGCGTSAGIGSLLHALLWRDPSLPAASARGSPRRPGQPFWALEPGHRGDQCREPVSAAASCFSRSRSLRRAEPCCGHLRAASGTCLDSLQSVLHWTFLRRCPETRPRRDF